ncbi:MAG: hypothetical protein ACE5ID_11895 [Acidobacteriota bacterium]
MRLAVFLSYILYCFYIGVLLVFLPWSPLWEANGLASRFPALGVVVLAGPVRGAISGLGVLLLMMGVVDALRFIRYGSRTEPPGAPPLQRPDGRS